MKIKHGTGKPKENHEECNNKECNNYYNINYSDSNGYCKPCNIRKKKNETI